MNNKANRGGWFGKVLLLVLIPAFGFVLAMFCYNETPSQVWQRIAVCCEGRPQPKPLREGPSVPAATPASSLDARPLLEPALAGGPPPGPVATPTAMPTSTPEPVPTATPQAVDPVAWLIANKSRWPSEVALVQAVEVPAIFGGKQAGSITLHPSSKVSVVGITQAGVNVEFMGGRRLLPYTATNLAAIARIAMENAQSGASMPGPALDSAASTRVALPVSSSLPPGSRNGLDAWTAVGKMAPGINIGNTFDNTAHWETGWGNPPVTKEYIQSLARLGFKTVRLPVAWDTFADQGHITPKQFQRIDQVVSEILDAGMFCVIDIHWDGGWIDSDMKERYPDTFHTFSAEAEGKFRSYWEQISRHYADRNEKLIFEAFNEESSFDHEGSEEKMYATLTRVNQFFVDTVRKTGGKNSSRLLIVPGLWTDLSRTCRDEYRFPKDIVPGKLLVSIHYYSPYVFVGMTEDAGWGKVQLTWGSDEDVQALNKGFDKLSDFCIRNNAPAFVGEFGVCSKKEVASRIRWTTAVMQAALKRKMVPVLWDTGDRVSRKEPYAANEELIETLRGIHRP